MIMKENRVGLCILIFLCMMIGVFVSYSVIDAEKEWDNSTVEIMQEVRYTIVNKEYETKREWRYGYGYGRVFDAYEGEYKYGYGYCYRWENVKYYYTSFDDGRKINSYEIYNNHDIGDVLAIQVHRQTKSDGEYREYEKTLWLNGVA